MYNEKKGTEENQTKPSLFSNYFIKSNNNINI